LRLNISFIFLLSPILLCYKEVIFVPHIEKQGRIAKVSSYPAPDLREIVGVDLSFNLPLR
jgi:hypothetical protein